MPIGYNPNVINPGGIDYAEVDNLINPPNSANAGKTIVIDEDGKPTLGEGGGGSVGVLYTSGAEPAETDPALEQFIEEHPGVEFTNDAFPVSTMPDGEPMDYAALVEFSNAYNVVIIRDLNEKMDDLVLQYYQTDGVEENAGTYALGVKYISSFGTNFGVWFSNSL